MKALINMHVLIALVLLVLGGSGPAYAASGDCGVHPDLSPEKTVCAVWHAARTKLTSAPASWREDVVAIHDWLEPMLERHADARFLARRLFGAPDADPPEASTERLGAALDDWLALRGAAAVHANLSQWRKRLAADRTALEIIRTTAGAGDGLASVHTRLKLADRVFNLVVHLHRRDERWRIYDADIAGLRLADFIHAAVAPDGAESTHAETVEALESKARRIRRQWARAGR